MSTARTPSRSARPLSKRAPSTTRTSLRTFAGTPSLRNPLPLRRLPGQQKCLDQLTLAAHGHTGKALVPLTLGHFGLRVEPCREQLKLRRRDLPALNALEQMPKERGRNILSADFRHGRSDAVEAARQPLLDAGGL